MGITLRAFQGPPDYAQVRRLLRDNIDAAAELAILDWCRFITQANAETLPQLRLWVDDRGRLVAFVWPDFGGSEIITRADCGAAFEPILDWEEAQAGANPLRIVLDEREGERTTMVQGRGYRRATEISFYARRSLDDAEPIPAPRLPEGYIFAHVGDLANLDGRVATEREAMPWSPTTVAMYQAIQRVPDYCADLDLVVLGPAGDVAAFCTFWPEMDMRIGVVEPIGCHPAHQRRGLASALLYEGMQRLKALGIRDVYIGNGPVPETLQVLGPPRRLTASVGFQHISQKFTWVKEQPDQMVDTQCVCMDCGRCADRSQYHEHEEQRDSEYRSCTHSLP